MAAGTLKRGAVKRLRAKAKKVVDALVLEHEVVKQVDRHAAHTRLNNPAGVDIFHMDVLNHNILEGFSGDSNISDLAGQYGLKALEPAEIKKGWDLSTPEGAKRWQTDVTTHKPLLVVIGFPCVHFCTFATNVNFVNHPKELEQLRKKDYILLDLMIWTMHEQMAGGRYFLFESPPGSAIYNSRRLVEEIYSHPEVQSVIGHMCQYGAVGKRRGLPIRKAMRWLSNSSKLLLAVGARCPGDHEHEKVEGQNTESSQIYTPRLAHSILQAVCELAKQRDTFRFVAVAEQDNHRFHWALEASHDEWQPTVPCEEAHDVFYLDVSMNLETWAQILSAAESLTAGRASPAPLVLDKGITLYDQIQDMVPWQLSLVQVVRLPKARRMPPILATHRGAALLTNDGEVFVESEAMRDVAYPCQKYVKPVRIAVYFYGYAPQAKDERPEAKQEVKAEQEAADKLDPEPGAPLHPDARVRDESVLAGIRFPNLSADLCPPDVSRIVARIHVNLGHPIKRELLQYCAAQGASAAVMAAINHLECDACNRRRAPARPPPSTLAIVGQFNDTLYLDIVHRPDAVGVTRIFLGTIDDMSHLHVVRRLVSRDAHDTFQMFYWAWLLPYGLPLCVVADKDGAFQGEFEHRLSQLGVPLRLIPAEAHWKLGKIERHNHVWGMIWQKVVDHNGASTDHEVDDAAMAAEFAKNSMIRRVGRTPYQVAFGRVPRLAGQLLNDESAAPTLENVSADTALARQEQYRADAIKAFAEVDQSRHLRAAINRKTVMRPDTEFVPGQRVAWYRERAVIRAGYRTKRAGYVIGTFLFYDPGGPSSRHAGKTAWVSHAGSAIQVAVEQLRPAAGFEEWTPSKQDLDELRRAESQLQQQPPEEAHSHKEPGPSKDEPTDPTSLQNSRNHQKTTPTNQTYPQVFLGPRRLFLYHSTWHLRQETRPHLPQLYPLHRRRLHRLPYHFHQFQKIINQHRSNPHQCFQNLNDGHRRLAANRPKPHRQKCHDLTIQTSLLAG